MYACCVANVWHVLEYVEGALFLLMCLCDDWLSAVVVGIAIHVVVIIVMTLSGKWDKCIFRSCHTTIW